MKETENMNKKIKNEKERRGIKNERERETRNERKKEGE